jgi:putative cardiolipin synthase
MSELPLERLFGPMVAAHPGLSGVQLLDDGPMSLAVRVLLARKASRTIEAQYYIWRDDVAGRMLFDELLAAADRGVRVRLLLDDFGSAGLDARLAVMVVHPLIEVRLFNPLRLRFARWVNFLFDFGRLNRRMHNKSFTVDGVATVIGGRNIGDEYFDAGHPGLFADLDVLAVGEVAARVGEDFDRYWQAEAARPLADVVTRPPALRAGAADDVLLRVYREAVSSDRARALIDEAEDFDWAPVRMVSDDPAKILGKVADDALPLAQLVTLLGPVQTRLTLMSAYFVPMAEGVSLFAGLAQSGVAVSILTNSLRSTDVALTHAGYAPDRRRLIEGGVQLWEMKGKGGDRAALGLVPRSLRRDGSGGTSFFRSSASALHAKTLVVDGARLFVGSMNFDPRSWRLNTEIGFVIECEALAGRVEGVLEAGLPAFAWAVRLEAGRLVWRGRTAVHRTEPGTWWLQRAVIRMVGWLPVAWLL